MRHPKTSKLCGFCGEPFDVHLCRKDTAEYCSRSCMHLSQKWDTLDRKMRDVPKPSQIVRNCLFCGKEFAVHPFRLETAKWCRQRCYYEWRKQQTWGGATKKCPRCGEVKLMESFVCGGTKQTRVSVCYECRVVYNATRDKEALRIGARQRYCVKVKVDPAWRTQHQEFAKHRYHTDPEFRMARSMSHRLARNQRRAQIAGSGGHVSIAQWREILRLHGYACVYCGSKEHISQDHVIPLSRGGRHVSSNIMPACVSCNSSKQDKTLPEWFVMYPEIKQAILARTVYA